METLLSICIGVGLSAACGFRIFVPPLIMSLASLSGNLALSSGFEWIGTYPALTAFALATGVEIAGYYVPWVDHLLDTIATPSAVIAGTIVTAAMVSEVSPFLKWTLAVIAGGGAAGLVQGATVVARGMSTAASGGLANPLVATAELGLSTFTALLAVLVPVAAVGLLIGLAGFAGHKMHRRISSQPASQRTTRAR